MFLFEFVSCSSDHFKISFFSELKWNSLMIKKILIVKDCKLFEFVLYLQL